MNSTRTLDLLHESQHALQIVVQKFQFTWWLILTYINCIVIPNPDKLSFPNWPKQTQLRISLLDETRLIAPTLTTS